MDKYLSKRTFGGPAATTEPPKKKAKTKPVKIEGKTVEQHRRMLGDAVKTNINVEKWGIEARTSMEAIKSLAVFKALVVPNSDFVTPSSFSLSTPAVVAGVRSSSALGEIFGHTKIKGGTRAGSWTADKAYFIFFRLQASSVFGGPCGNEVRSASKCLHHCLEVSCV